MTFVTYPHVNKFPWNCNQNTQFFFEDISHESIIWSANYTAFRPGLGEFTTYILHHTNQVSNQALLYCSLSWVGGDAGRCLFGFVNCIFLYSSRWRHQVEAFSALLVRCVGNSPVTGEFPAQGPVGRSFDVFLDLRLNKRLNKQSWGWSFGTPSHSLWRHCNGDIPISFNTSTFPKETHMG